jgi:hypothetical protein
MEDALSNEQNVTFCNTYVASRFDVSNYMLYLKELGRLAADERVHAFMLIPDSLPWGKFCPSAVQAWLGAKRERFECSKFAAV